MRQTFEVTAARIPPRRVEPTFVDIAVVAAAILPDVRRDPYYAHVGWPGQRRRAVELAVELLAEAEALMDDASRST